MRRPPPLALVMAQPDTMPNANVPPFRPPPARWPLVVGALVVLGFVGAGVVLAGGLRPAPEPIDVRPQSRKPTAALDAGPAARGADAGPAARAADAGPAVAAAAGAADGGTDTALPVTHPAAEVTGAAKRPDDEERLPDGDAKPRGGVKPAPPEAPDPLLKLPVEVRVFVRPWANVSIDDKRLGTTPIKPQRLLPGKHKLRLEKDGVIQDHEFDVVPGENLELRYRLDP
jgi:hypothetical protein